MYILNRYLTLFAISAILLCCFAGPVLGQFERTILYPHSNVEIDTSDYFKWTNELAKEDYQLGLEYVDGRFLGPIRNVKKDGNFLYYTVGQAVVVIDVSDPLSPEYVSSYRIVAWPYDLDFGNGSWTEDYLFVTNRWADLGSNGVFILDKSNPMELIKVGQYNPDTIPLLDTYGIKVLGGTVYVCAGRQGLQVVNAADPELPKIIGMYLNSNPIKFVNSGPIAYLVDGGTFFDIVDITHSSDIWQYSYVVTEGHNEDLDIKDNYVFLAQQTTKDQVEVIDVGDPYNPLSVAVYDDFNGGEPWEIDVVGDYAYVGFKNLSEVHILDISDPLTPTRAGIITGLFESWAIEVDGDYAYIASDHWLSIADVTDVSNPVTIDSCFYHHNFFSSVFSENLGFFVYDLGLLIADISNPESIEFISSDTFMGHYNLDIQGDYVYANQDRKFGIIDVSDPYNPVHIAEQTISPFVHIRDLAVQGDYLYLAADTAGLQIYDISDPYNISLVGFYNDIYFGGYGAWSVEVSGDYVYLGDFNGMMIFDVSDPSNPKPLEQKYLGRSRISDIEKKGDLVFLADEGPMSSGDGSFWYGIHAVDVSDPEYPVLVGSYDSLWECKPQDIDISGNYLYIIGYYTGRDVRIVDISDPSNMTVEKSGYFATNGNVCYGIGAHGRHAYVGTEGGLLVLKADVPWNCGDGNDDGNINILDITYLINYLYMNGSAPSVLESADVNNSGSVNLLDITYLISFLYNSGPAPVCPE